MPKWLTPKRRVGAAAAGAVLLAFYFALIAFAEPFLCVRSVPTAADAIVVLGGEPVVRAEVAASLVAKGLSARVVVSGTGDCETNAKLLQAKGVTPHAIQVECASASTRENAEFTVALLRQQSLKRVIIVTSWFHSRRAMNCFRHYAPEISFISAPVPRVKPWQYDRGYIAAEYVKTVWYAL